MKAKLRNLLQSSHTIALSRGTIFDKKNAKKADISKMKEFLVLKGIF